ncbi:MAG: helix-turn-helix domain-containing protein [Actinobacteria bacterium]|nr:helix-turn-helix domain-containing protein [Actinomycetota bacterium]
MDIRDLEQTLNQLTATLGDPTRRSIYLRVRSSPEPLTATLVANEFCIHPNVARHHLDRLTEEGYLEVTRRRTTGKTGPGAGRPAKCYAPTGKEIDLQFPTRRHDLLIDLLVRIVLHLAPEDGLRVALEIGRDFGRELASGIATTGDNDLTASLETVAALMQREGFEVIADSAGEKLLTEHCPFSASKFEHPEVLCSLDRGIMTGIFEIVDPQRAAALEVNLEMDHACITTV